MLFHQCEVSQNDPFWLRRASRESPSIGQWRPSLSRLQAGYTQRDVGGTSHRSHTVTQKSMGTRVWRSVGLAR